MDVPVKEKTWDGSLGSGCRNYSSRIIRRMETLLDDLLGGALVIWVIYANLFKTEKVKRKKNFVEKMNDYVDEQIKYDEKITQEYEESLWQQEINRQNGHYY